MCTRNLVKAVFAAFVCFFILPSAKDNFNGSAACADIIIIQMVLIFLENGELLLGVVGWPVVCFEHLAYAFENEVG